MNGVGIGAVVGEIATGASVGIVLPPPEVVVGMRGETGVYTGVNEVGFDGAEAAPIDLAFKPIGATGARYSSNTEVQF